MAARKLAVEETVLKLVRDNGLPREVAAARFGVTTNHAWAICALAGFARPVSDGQRAIARSIVDRKRRQAAGGQVIRCMCGHPVELHECSGNCSEQGCPCTWARIDHRPGGGIEQEFGDESPFSGLG